MNFLILARKPEVYSNVRLLEEGAALGLEVSIQGPDDFELSLQRNLPTLRLHGEPFQPVHAVMSRMGASISKYGMSVLMQFERTAVKCMNSAESIFRTQDKMRCLQYLSQGDVDIPKSTLVRQVQNVDHIVEQLGGYPVILKLLSGSQGVGVMIAENRRSLEPALDTLWSLGQEILLQEFIHDSVGQDIRAFVVGGKVVAAIRRQARVGDFRANVHRGGVATAMELDAEQTDIAIRSAEIMGLDIAGVDMLESREGPKVIEVNSSPGLEAIEKATDRNIAREMLLYSKSKME